MADILEKLLFYFKSALESDGFEVYPFLTDWYNNTVDRPFHLSYPQFTLAYVVLSTPSMFEKTFIPYVRNISPEQRSSNQDFIDQAVHAKLDGVREECTLIDNHNIDLFHDYDMTHNRRPKILVQTAADVAGAVRLYQQSDLNEYTTDFPPKKKIFPCALHPLYGGWFAIRGVYIFKNIINPLLEQPERKEILKNAEDIHDLLLKYNLRWEDWSFRDVIEPLERYSELQKLFFKTPPAERGPIIQQIIDSDSLYGKEEGNVIEEASDVLQYDGIA